MWKRSDETRKALPLHTKRGMRFGCHIYTVCAEGTESKVHSHKVVVTHKRVGVFCPVCLILMKRCTELSVDSDKYAHMPTFYEQFEIICEIIFAEIEAKPLRFTPPPDRSEPTNSEMFEN